MVAARRAYALRAASRREYRPRQTPDEEHDRQHEAVAELLADVIPGRQLMSTAMDGSRALYEVAEQDKEWNEQHPEEQQAESSDGQSTKPVAGPEDKAK